ncbi:mucin-17-like isoform X3 [Sesbania bispinosa]|nr:mucin-17-like isoform X3 [Sesbania bispinosa]
MSRYLTPTVEAPKSQRSYACKYNWYTYATMTTTPRHPSFVRHVTGRSNQRVTSDMTKTVIYRNRLSRLIFPIYTLDFTLPGTHSRLYSYSVELISYIERRSLYRYNPVPLQILKSPSLPCRSTQKLSDDQDVI